MRKLLLLVLFVAAAGAQARAYDQPDLDALLAPIALYPDSLVSHILIASAYPDQVAQAARGTPAEPHWHPSVSALLSVPELLQRMAESPQWMHDLSQAYIHQQAAVMGTVQELRARAQAHGYSAPPEREVIYVRHYDPLVVYGPWWWPAHRPVFWHPWPVTRIFVHHHHHPRHHFQPHKHAVPAHRGVHTKPYVRVPESQRRPIVHSTPQLFHKPQGFHQKPQGLHHKPRSFAERPALRGHVKQR